jgi:hypothetical protein
MLTLIKRISYEFSGSAFFAFRALAKIGAYVGGRYQFTPIGEPTLVVGTHTVRYDAKKQLYLLNSKGAKQCRRFTKSLDVAEQLLLSGSPL